MDALRGNLDALREADPELAARTASCDPSGSVDAFAAESGAWSFRIDGRLHTSARDPVAEACELAERVIARAEHCGASRLVLFGLVPYALAPLARYFEAMLVIEPSLELLRAVLDRIDLAAWLRRGAILAGEDAIAHGGHTLLASPLLGMLEAHTPSRRRAPQGFERVARAFRGGGPERPLDVAVIPPAHGGSLPVARAAARALRELGHRVREYELEPLAPAQLALDSIAHDLRLAPLRAELHAAWRRLASRALVESLELDPPDLVFALAQAPLDARALAQLRARDVPTALWFCEDFRVMTWWRELAPLYDRVFHLQPETFAAPLRDAGARGDALPMGFDPSLHRPLLLPPEERARYATDLSFVGAAYHNRVCFLPGLFDQGLRVYGVGWPQAGVWAEVQPEPGVRQSTEASNRIFNSTEINLNLHSSPWVDGVNPGGDYLNPRTFELAGAERFQLVDARIDLARSFRPGEELETFRDLDECRSKIRHYLAHPEQRTEIARRGAERARREHTYRHRMEEAIAQLRDGRRPLAARKNRAFLGAVRDEAAGAAPELLPLLERLTPDRALDAGALRALVAAGTGPLSREEKRLLFMREAAAEAVFAPGAAR